MYALSARAWTDQCASAMRGQSVTTQKRQYGTAEYRVCCCNAGRTRTSSRFPETGCHGPSTTQGLTRTISCSYFPCRHFRLSEGYAPCECLQVVLSCPGFVFVRNMIVRKHLLSPTRRVGGRQEGERWRSGSAECMQGRLACPAHYTLTLIHSLFFSGTGLKDRQNRRWLPGRRLCQRQIKTTRKLVHIFHPNYYSGCRCWYGKVNGFRRGTGRARAGTARAQRA